MDFKGKRVLILGLGGLGGGISAANFFYRKGANLTITDLKSKHELKESLHKLRNIKANFVLGRHRKEDFFNADLIIKNPAVSSSCPFLTEALRKKIKVEMIESLFVKLSKSKNIIGVTGTRGKSTVSALIYNTLKKAGDDAFLAGNIPNVSTLALLETVKEKSIVVLELSSWQLEGFGWSKISPHVSIVTNIYPDHLNRYQSMKDYIADKKNIFKFQKKEDYLILNKNDRYSKEFAKESKSKIIWFSKSNFPKSWSISLLGKHNLENAACSYQAAKIYQIREDVLKNVFSSFKALPFRLNIIGKFEGRTIINDSTSTTPAALIAALRSFPPKKIILICGGNEKKLPLGELQREIKANCKFIFFLKGSGTDLLFPKLKKTMPKRVYGSFDNLKDILRVSYLKSKKGDIILFSPGFTSFAMFKNEFDRGEKFKNETEAFFKKKAEK